MVRFPATSDSGILLTRTSLARANRGGSRRVARIARHGAGPAGTEGGPTDAIRATLHEIPSSIMRDGMTARERTRAPLLRHARCSLNVLAMTELVVLAVTLALYGACAAFVRFCDRI
jgi:hypothetical protein